jgi:hypothetical protein
MTQTEFDVTKARVIELARKRAEELNVPWGNAIVAQPMIPFWRSSPGWRVFSVRFSDRLVVTMWVNRRTGKADPHNAVYYADRKKFERRLAELKIAPH